MKKIKKIVFRFRSNNKTVLTVITILKLEIANLVRVPKV